MNANLDYLHTTNKTFPGRSMRILHDPVGRTPRHVCRLFCAKNIRSDLPVFTNKQYLAKNLDLTRKPSRLKELTYLTHFFA